MFILNCHITIGRYHFQSVHEVVVNRSIHSFIDNCLIKIPASARLRFEGEKPTESIIDAGQIRQTADLFTVGDAVTVQLGYNGDLKTEFKGFVKRVNFTSPLEIECEGYSYQLKQKNINKSWASISLKGLLNEITSGTSITLSEHIPDVKLNNVFFRNIPADQVLNWLQDKLLMTVYFNFSELYAGLAYAPYKGVVKYKLGWNTVKGDELKYHLASDTKIKIKAIYVRPDNSRLEVEVGDSEGSTRTVFITHVRTIDELRAAAENKLNMYKYNGYSGKITAFLQPFAEHGYKAVLEDDRFPERSGSYMIESVQVQFGTQGARRVCEIGVKV